MTRFRLLPIVLFATCALLALKVLGLMTGAGSFALGPVQAVAAGGGGGGHAAKEPPSVAEPSIEDPMIIESPLDLAKEAEEFAKKQEEQGGHGAAAGGHGAPAEGGHGAEAEGGHGAPADDGHSAPAEGGHGADAAGGGHAAPADGAHADPAAGDHAAAPDAGHGAPAADGHGAPAADGHGAPAADGHGGGGAGSKLYTDRPEEYQPPGSDSEDAVLMSLTKRREELDQRDQDIQLRMKLLEATEGRLQKRLDELKSIESQLGGTGEDGAPTASGQMKTLAGMYEIMKPKAAAEVFAQLEADVMVEIARQMDPRKLSTVMSVMDPQTASKLTMGLAGETRPREVLVRTEMMPDVSMPAAGAPEELPKIMPAAPVQ